MKPPVSFDRWFFYIASRLTPNKATDIATRIAVIIPCKIAMPTPRQKVVPRIQVKPTPESNSATIVPATGAESPTPCKKFATTRANRQENIPVLFAPIAEAAILTGNAVI